MKGMARISLSTASCAVILGTAPLLWLPVIPPVTALWLLAGGGLLLVSLVGCLRVLGIALLTLVWACNNARDVLETLTRIDGKTLRAEVSIAEMRLTDYSDKQVLLRVETLDGRWLHPAFYVRATLPPTMSGWCGGQRWAVTATFRPLHSRLNEGGFDRQRWGVAKRQLATARIASTLALDSSCSLRQRLVTRLEQPATALTWRAILLALAFGEMKGLAPQTRTLLVQTGTMHLMVISGLHVGLAALFGWGMARVVQFLLPAAWIGYRSPLVVGVVIVWCYAWLAGGNPPALRAALAFSIWSFIRVRGIACSAWQIWLWCVAAVLLCDPLMSISSSLWLSCLAVAGLIFWCQWVPLPPRYRVGWRWGCLRLAHLQVGMVLLMMPLQGGLFHGFSTTSLPANLWAAPLVSFVVTPLVLLALPFAPFPHLSQALWALADRAIAVVFAPLNGLPQGWVIIDERYLSWSLFGWVGVVIWRFAWWRTHPASVLVLIGLIVLPRLVAPRPEWRLDMLDVGHGLAIVIERQGRALLYDTGGQWEGGDMMTRDILPYLRWRGIVPEGVIISHSHRDHIGGLASLLQAYPALPVYSPLMQGTHRACVQGEHWQWRNLTLRVLWPPRRVDYAENDDSCVIQIDDGVRRILLTGDIVAASERQLTATQRAALSADLLQIPHHGSSTSSTLPFVRAVKPRYALASTGRYNPWRLPSAPVVRRYRRAGVHWVDTAQSGQVSVRFFSDKWEVLRYREQLSPRWYHQWFGVKRDNE